MAALDQIDLNSLTIFDAVVEAGSFTAAADRLDVAKAKISVQINRLERQLGAALFTRTTRQMALTDAGRNLHEQCQPLLAGLRDALTQVGSEQGELTGLLRLSASVSHATLSIAPAVAEFSRLHPHLRIDLRTGDRISDLVADGIDLSFRMGWLRDSSQRAIKLGEFQQFIVAAPAYLKKHGIPKVPEDLSEHQWIALSLLPAPLTWKIADASGSVQTIHMKSRMQVDSPNALLALLQAGAGISAMEELSSAMAIKAGKLQRLLPDYELPKGGIYAVLPPGRHMPGKVRAFVDFYKTFINTI
ncbi:LysR family transcriptional regulator [Undibacterium umbellatum]|uniref:LysR family transcriptional regulator n=1 Tax=Undibacterium umbellatum TaxID=2762300 RepID=A0ABR6Z538_9BURK|nr:LysR family transcriptional regulator [Undibacterium umbellatum]MBC3906669.1 LysR family transcriptional regulator [Undibacterium umbellatum]